MEMCKDESQAAVTQQKSLNGEKKSRLALVPSEKNNVTPVSGKQRTKEVTSRYKLSTTLTTRCSSPNASKQTNAIGTHRSISVERKRPTTPSPTRCFVPSSPPSTPSSKSSRLSSPSPLSSQSSRPTTPLRDTMDERLTSSRRSLVGHTPDGLWPSITSLSTTFQSDTSSIRSSKKITLSRNPSPDPMLKSSETKKTLAVKGSHVKAADQLRWPSMIGGNMLTRSMDLMDKATRSPSLSTSARGFSPSRRFRTSSIEVAPPASPKVSEKSSHLMSLSRITSSVRQRSPSPTPGLVCPLSPNKASSISRAMSSPTKSRLSSPCSSSSSILTRDGVSSSMLSYIVDVRKGKKSPSQIEIAHHLRLLHTRDLQWRFVNARAESEISTQYLVSEAALRNACGITSEIRDAIIMRRMNVHYIRREIRLKSILNEQIAYLEGWNELEGEHSNSLLGTIRALKSSTLCLPIAGHTRANACDLKNAISSAVDMMQAMGSSICYLLSRVENANSVISELSESAASESIMLDQCWKLLTLAAEMQVQECSLRTQIMQLKQQNVQVEVE